LNANQSVVRCAVVSTKWGHVGLVARGDLLIATYLPDRAAEINRRIHRRWPDALEDSSILPDFRKQLFEYLAGRRTRFEVDIDLSDLPLFHRAVLTACRGIPFGQTASYAELAREVGRPRAARAVGQAMGNNPMPLVIPCHRIIASDGTIGGFSSSRGVTQKERLLQHEGVSAPRRPVRRRDRPTKHSHPRRLVRAPFEGVV
jgi:methylated-DNA-[protein]-cysteine S-methyltransferase